MGLDDPVSGSGGVGVDLGGRADDEGDVEQGLLVAEVGEGRGDIGLEVVPLQAVLLRIAVVDRRAAVLHGGFGHGDVLWPLRFSDLGIAGLERRTNLDLWLSQGLFIGWTWGCL